MKKILLILCCFTIIACGTRKGPDLAVERGFNAISDDDWAEYTMHIMTPLTYEMRLNKVSAIKQKMHYQDKAFGAVQDAAMRKHFDVAVQGCQECTALKNTKLIKVANVGSKHFESLTGDLLPYDIYQVTVLKDGVEMLVNYPRFAIVSIGERYHIMSLLMPNESIEEVMYAIEEELEEAPE